MLAFITNAVTDGWEERKGERKGNELEIPVIDWGNTLQYGSVCDIDVDYHLYRYELLNKKG